MPVEVEAGRVVFEGEPHGDFYNPMGTVHGGWIATLIDTAMACAVHSSLKAGEIFTTVEMNVTYVRPGAGDDGQAALRGRAAAFRRPGRQRRRQGLRCGRQSHRARQRDLPHHAARERRTKE